MVSKKEVAEIHANYATADAKRKQEEDDAQGIKQTQLEKFYGKVQALKDSTYQAASGSFAFMNTNGDSGTVALAFCMTMLTEYGRRVAIAADMSPSNGTLAARLGMDLGVTISTDNLRQHKHELCADAVTLWDNVRPNDYGTFVLSSTTNYGDWITPQDNQEIIGILQAFHSYVGMGIPLDIASKAVQAAIKANDVLAFTAWADDPHSLRQMQATIVTFHKDPVLKKRVQNAVVIILGASPIDAKGERFRQYVQLPLVASDASGLVSPVPDSVQAEPDPSVAELEIVVVTDDQALRDKDVVNIAKWQRETLNSFVDICTVLMRHLAQRDKSYRQPLIRPSAVDKAGGEGPRAIAVSEQPVQTGGLAQYGMPSYANGHLQE